ncbi:hypothetical protein Dimus_014900 [Dionaea muscipula]
MSSNSKASRRWLRGNHHPTHRYSASDGAGLYFSSPSDTSLFQPWTPPPVQEISVDDFENSSKRDPVWGPLTFTPTMEGSSTLQDGGGSTSSRSDGSEFEHGAKLNSSNHYCNFPSRCSFMSKPIHPLSFPIQNPAKEDADQYDATTASASQRETRGSSSGGSSSIDLTDISEPFESENLGRGRLGGASNPAAEGSKCGLCERFLSQKSPWSSRRIVRSGDMPVTGVLACCHVFHAECLEQTTPKARKSDPPCPLCYRTPTEEEEEDSPEQQQQQLVVTRLKNNLPKFGPFEEEEGSSRAWGCAQAGDCVEGALRGPQRSSSSMLLVNRNRMRKSLSGKEFPGKWSKSSSYPLQLRGERFVGRGPGS